MTLKFSTSLLAVLAFGISSSASLASRGTAPFGHIPKSAAMSGTSTFQKSRQNADAPKKHFTVKRGKRVGYVLELVVSCFDRKKATWNSGVITYSILDKSFCNTNRKCHSSATSAVKDFCRSSLHQDAVWSKQ